MGTARALSKASAGLRRLLSPIALFAGIGLTLLAALLLANSQSGWVARNGGLASWMQALGSLYAIVAVSYPVMLERQFARQRARRTVLSSAELACGLMSTVADRAYNPDAAFSEWWVPQWHVIEEVLASAPIHDMDAPGALEAFVNIRELYGRMRRWEEGEGGQQADDSMQGYVMVLCMNADMSLRTIRAALT